MSKTLDPELYTKSGKLRKRKRKKPINYFTEETQNAIVDYNNSTDVDLRNKLFNEKINWSIHKLVENIIHTFKFYHTELDNVEQLKHEVVAFLLQKLHLYKKDKGKAYSYFGTIAKRYLIIYDAECYKRQKEKASLDEVDEDVGIYTNILNEGSESDVLYFLQLFIEYLEAHVDEMFPKDVDKKTGYAVLELFRRRESIEVMNKQALYLYVKEQTGNTAAQITKALKQLKELYRKLMNEYYLTGDIKI
jgi:hypothetical protein